MESLALPNGTTTAGGFHLRAAPALARLRIVFVQLSPPKHLLAVTFRSLRLFQLFTRGRKSLGGGGAGARRIRTCSPGAALAGGCAAALCCIGLPLGAATSALPNYFIRVWQTEEGLPHNAVTTIVQTREGYLWLGTYDGLARFDGATFTVFDSNKDSASEMGSSRVVSLFEAGDGGLWIGHETGDLTLYRDGRFESVQINTNYDNRKILGISADESERIWVLREDGRLTGVHGEMVSPSNAGTATRVAALVRNANGGLWALYGGEVFRLEGDQLVPLTQGGSFPAGYVAGICASHDGGLWVASNGRVRKWDGHDLIDDLGPSPWDQSSITAAIETRSGCLAVGTLDQGLYLVFPHRGVLHFNRESGFPHDWVRSLFEDREGTLWAGTGSGGLVALRASNVARVDAPDHWQGRVVLSVTAARDGALWVGTEGAGLYRLLDNQWTHFGESNGLSNQFVWSVSEDLEGRLWAGTWGGGLFIQHGDHFKFPRGLEDITVPTTAVLHAQGDVTWVGTGEGLLRYEDGRTRWFGRKEGLSLPDVRAVVEGRGGDVWFGMLGGGLGRLHDGVAQQFRKSEGISSDYVQCLELDEDGTLWIGTYGAGLNRLKNGRFSSISTSQGLPNNFICDIKEDDRGNFWFSSHGGIFRIPKGELNRCADGQTKAVRCFTYGKGDGMPTLECSGGLQPAGCKTADGRLWFPTSKGLVVVDPNNAKTNQLPPPIVIEAPLVDGHVVTNAAKAGLPLRIPPGQQRFEFRYTALTFVAPEKVEFQYRLEGLDPDWTDGGTKRSVNYSHIPPGHYTFHVIGCNSDGVWNYKGATLEFTVEPYFWQMWWFRALTVLAAGALVAGGVLVVARRRMHRKLERLERQRAIERERARIAQDIHDNLGASLTRISLLSQSAYADLDNPRRAAAELERIYTTTRELTRAMDEIVWAVDPQHDTLDSLVSYLGKFAQDFLAPLRIRCRLDVPEQLPAWPVTAEVRHNLFLAFKEALHNVVKHAAASEVCISLNADPDGFTLLVRDDGVGFDPPVPMPPASGQSNRIARGNGLTNMRHRLEKLGGHCEIRSAPGQGTGVKFVVGVAARSAQELS